MMCASATQLWSTRDLNIFTVRCGTAECAAAGIPSAFALYLAGAQLLAGKRAFQHPPGMVAGRLAIFKRDLAIDDGGVNALSLLHQTA